VKGERTGLRSGHSSGGRQRRHSISNIMIIKLGPTIAAYEACITLFLIFVLWCWRRLAEASKVEAGSLVLNRSP
jgi:hypothetical protein